MKNKIIISLLPLKKNFDDLEQIKSKNKHSIFASKNSIVKISNVSIFVEGYVLPRNNIFLEYSTKNQYELIYQLYSKHGKNFVKYIKGFFLVYIIDVNDILIANDIHSVKRCYYHKDLENLIITNNINLINNYIPLRLNKYAPAIQATLQHFVNGLTMYEDVLYSMPATLIEISKKFKKFNYWDFNEIIKEKKSTSTKQDFINVFKKSISNYIEYFKPANVSATLTGGRDTRSVLSALVNLKVRVHNFTFGYPTGIDVITAKEVSNKLDLAFSNHNIENLNTKTYSDLVDGVVNVNKTSIHIHRAHRLDAIIKEKEYCNDTDMLFVGAMGGDYIMGEGFNDYIITKFVRKFLTEERNPITNIKETLDEHFVKYDDDTITFLLKYLEDFGLKHNIFNKEVEFNLVHNLIGCTHDVQDINIFMNYCNNIMSPFMDVDVIETLFTSNFSLFYNNRHTKNPIKRLRGGELQCLLIKTFAPQLADVNFSNQYSPNDVLGNRFLYVIKRIFIQLTKKQSTPTFSYEDWFKDFVSKEMETLPENLKDLYDIKKFDSSLKNNTHNNDEGYWHKYSNLIMFSKYLKINN